jgi:hypothetical protein
LALWPRPRAWPSSCKTTASKSNWPAWIAVGSAAAYQFHPWTRVISVESVPGVSQPSTPSAKPPTAVVVFVSRMTLAEVLSVVSVMVPP